MREFVHLHNHSDYSLLDGASPVKGMAERALEIGCQHLALTDHGNLFGAAPFYKACRAAKVHPIIGCEVYLSPGSRLIKKGNEMGNNYYHLILLAKNTLGYRNLMRLVSIGYLEGFYYKPRIDFETLSAYSQGLICLSACIAGELPQLILSGREGEAEKLALRYGELFGPGNYYLEIQDHGLKEEMTTNRFLAALSQKTGLPLAATNDSHYLRRDDANAQDILMCIGMGKKKNEDKRLRFTGQEFYLKTPEEMAALFPSFPQALDNTLRIAEDCTLEIPFPGPEFPEFAIPQGFASPEDYLRHLCSQGLVRRYGTPTQEILNRAEYEVNTIIAMGFTGYFLIVWDYIHWARSQGIPVGPGRGSGAGSIVAYAMTITDIDPIKYNLLFERFLNSERVSLPDFDIDFCYERRQEVIDYIKRKYGEDKVGQIITFGSLKAKQVIRDVARVLDIPYGEADAIAKLVPGEINITLQQAIEKEPKLKNLPSEKPEYQELLEVSLKLEGLNRPAGTHAAGIVIGKQPLTDYVPLYRDPKTFDVSTQYSMKYLEDCGLV
ncbi:MAG: DNA polymerase III subunit alpha, partial [Spirochaetales bacterium]|nr:DNA polymerase III subunit alpha [Spirochaetales bacterium]